MASLESISNDFLIVSCEADLPYTSGKFKTLYVDFETTSFDNDTKALHPYAGHRILGAAVSVDDDASVYYIPLRHRSGRNIDVDVFRDWLQSLLDRCDEWVNHNVKFDMHFAGVEGLNFDRLSVVCTVVLAKLVFSDYPNYSLDNCVKNFLAGDMNEAYDRMEPYLRNGRKKIHDYAVIPIDIIADYACADVWWTRRLYRFLSSKVEAEFAGLWETEKKFTFVLFDMEREGMLVDPEDLQKRSLAFSYYLLSLEERLHKTVGFQFNPTSNEDCFEYLCTQNSLPVVEWTDGGRFAVPAPSFDKVALKTYLEMNTLSAGLRAAIEMISDYRKRHNLLTMFITPFLEKQVDGLIHPSYNQLVRTGRISCTDPNMMQLKKEAKELILPPPGRRFYAGDYSQIEFRLIVHVIKDEASIDAYNEDPFTDFHSWVAELCGIPRRPAKNVNFAIAYGGGKKKVITMLSAEPALTTELIKRVDEAIAEGKLAPEVRQQAAERLCIKRGEEVFEKYHATFPGLRIKSREAETLCRRRGYIRNGYGRRRHLPYKLAHKALNSSIQGWAMDIMKERMVAISPRFNAASREADLRLHANVHDETLFSAPADRDTKQVGDFMRGILESPSVPLRIPIRIQFGSSTKNWRDADSETNPVPR